MMKAFLFELDVSLSDWTISSVIDIIECEMIPQISVSNHWEPAYWTSPLKKADLLYLYVPVMPINFEDAMSRSNSP